MSPESTQNSIIAPDRDFFHDSLDYRRGSDIAIVTPPQALAAMGATLKSVQMAVKGASTNADGQINFASSRSGDPKLVAVPPTDPDMPGENTANQLVGTTFAYESQHGMVPEVLSLSQEAEDRMELIAEELAFRAHTMYTGSLSLPDDGVDSRMFDVNLDNLAHKFDPAANMFSLRSFEKLKATGVSKEQLKFMEKRREWTQLLLSKVTEKLAAQNVPGVQCYMNDRENDSPTIRVLFDRN